MARPSGQGFGISSWSIRNPIPTVVFFLLMTVVGWMGFSAMRVNNWPDVEFPMVVVTVVRSGAAPTELQNQVTRIVEDSISGLGGVRHIQSTVNEGASTSIVTFMLGTDLEKATNDVRNAVASVRGSLPSDVQDPIITRVDNAQGQALLSYIIRASNMTPEQLSWYVDNDVSKKVLGIKGVAKVTRSGGVDREIRIDLDPAKLAAQGVTAGDVSSQLRSFNVNLPGGRFTSGGTEQTIRTVGNAKSVADLSDMRISVSGKAVRLGDLGTVTDTWSEPRARARFNGSEVVGFDVERTRGSSEKAVAVGVRAEIEKLRKGNPNIEIEQVASSVDEVNRSFDASMEALAIGAALAVFVVWLFLRDWRATFVSAMAMPMSLLPTFWIMHLFNQSFNVVTLLALSLTIGILVDDAIVEIENIVRHIRDGKSPYKAAIEAADEIGLAVVATTATLIAVFAPTGFMPGIVGQFFQSFAVATCVSVFFSLVVARTLTPLMGAYILRSKPGEDHKEDKPFWMDWYQGLLKWCLRHRGVVVGLSIAFFAASAWLLTTIPGDNIPADDRSMSVMSVRLAPGSKLEETDATVQRIIREIKARPEVVSTYATMNMEKATIIINLVPKDKRKLGQPAFEQAISKSLLTKLPGIRASFGSDGGGGTGVAYILKSENGELLSHTAMELQREMAGLKELTNVSSEDNLTRPEIIITPKADQAALMGVSTSEISQAARVATMGDIDQVLAKYNDGDRQIPIRVLLKTNSLVNVDNLNTLMITTNSGVSVPLTAVADVRFGSGPIKINRLDRTRIATLSADLNGVPTGVADKAVADLPIMKKIKAGQVPGVSTIVNPNTEDFAEMGTNFVMAILTGVLLMYIVLVLLFGGFSKPLIILTALPLCFGGAFLALRIMSMSLSMPAFIGLIMLVGIAAKNSILLVEYAMVEIQHGVERTTALLDAARKRARPIVMTTVAMGAGMLPVTVGADAFRQPMAVAVVGGLITSTLLSLLFVPVMYTLIDGVSRRINKFTKPLFTAQGKAELDAEEAAGE
jgi:hydrophobic/amphiphilic exporter-1 (mainly G- bacteria), HAE1 family